MGRPRITTQFEVRVIVMSTWRYRFMAAWKLLKFLSHATDKRIDVCTARNRLRGARLIFELWNLNFNIDHFVHFWWRKWVYFQNVLLKMFTYVRHYMNFILSKVSVNIKTVLQNYCTQCLYWLNFFSWVYYPGIQFRLPCTPPRTIFHGCQIVHWDPLDKKRRCPQKKFGLGYVKLHGFYANP